MHRWIVGLAVMGAGCGEPEETGNEAPAPTFPTPWEDAAPLESTVSGQFRAVLGAQTPGAGWFRSGGAEAHDLVQAEVQEVTGATWPVVQLRIAGYEPDGWRVLELDVALNHWIAGEIPLDGTAATGVLLSPNGGLRYVVDGMLEVTAAGVEPGQKVEGTFRNLTLGEVTP